MVFLNNEYKNINKQFLENKQHTWKIIILKTFSKESQEAKKRHEEMLKKYELQKAARNISAPTNDYDVKMRLRELKHPICYFGEGPAERRERLEKILIS